MVLVSAAGLLCACRSGTFGATGVRPQAPVMPMLLDRALSWKERPPAQIVRGLDPIRDGSSAPSAGISLAREALRINPRLAPGDAMVLARAAVDAAHRYGLAPEFFGALLLQESAFDPDALSSAGAVGIAQFELDTAAAHGIDPFDPYDAIDGSARLTASYMNAYAGRKPSAWMLALAAYNAGPGAVDRYGGIPPYTETRGYIDDIFDRMTRMYALEPAPRGARPTRANYGP